MRILVLGGTGFIGRHAAAALRARGHTVVIGTRHPRRALKRLPPALRLIFQASDLRETHFESLLTRYVWEPLLRDFDAVLNSVGILRERGSETFDRVQNMAPRALAEACARLGVRLVHVSALGLRADSRSGFLRAKLRGERNIMRSAADYTIVRPSLLDGEGGFGAAWIRRVARWPVHFVPAEATGRLAVLDVRDLGEALAVLCEVRGQPDVKEIELGGAVARTMAQHLASLRALNSERPALRIAVPAFLARLVSRVCDALHFSPYSHGHLELMRRDNLPRFNLLPALLGRAPRPVGGEIPSLRPAYTFSAMPTGHETPVPPSPQ